MAAIRGISRFSGFMLVSAFVTLQTVNHVLFKMVALGPGGGSYFELFFDPLFYLCGFIFFSQFVVWLMVLKHYPLSLAYPFTSATLITIIASGALFFNESVTLGNVIGAMLIIIGVVVISGENKINNSEGNGRI